jgi:spore germination protein PF
MPAIIGPLQIFNVGGGVVQFGDTAIVSPKTSTKTTTGSGAFNTGVFIITNNIVSANPTIDSNLVDQPIIGNN